MLINLRNALMAGKKSPLPPGARWVEYLGSTGTQWIDTGVAPSTNDIFGMDTTFKVVNYNDGCCGSHGQGGAGNCYLNFYGNGLYVRKESFSSTTTDRNSWNQSGYYFPTGWNRVKMTDEIVINGNVVKTGIALTTNRNLRTIYLFAYNTGPASNLAKIQIANCAITQGTALVRDFRPIAIGMTGYMLDLVSGEYLPYGNKGSGDFGIGPDIPSPV